MLPTFKVEILLFIAAGFGGMKRFVSLKDTTAKKTSSGDQGTDCQLLASEAERAVQVMPSGEVMTRLVPLLVTAAKRPSSGDQVTDCQPLASASVRLVHVMPSGEVMTWEVPPPATATKMPS